MRMNAYTIKSSLAECCIVCLEKKSRTISIKESSGKLSKLSTLTNIKFDNYMEYSYLLCTLCDKRLTSSYSFLQQILKSIKILDDSKIKVVAKGSNRKPIIDSFKSCQSSSELEQEFQLNKPNPPDDTFHTVRRTPTSSIKPVPMEEVNNAIETFRKARGKCDNCLICGFTVSQRKYLIKHMAGQHMDRVPDWCRECNGMYENIHEHRKTHSRKFPCTFCGKLFRANSYVEHVMCHAGAFKCDLCGNMFNSASSLKKHKYLHTNYRPHRCPNCKKGFLQAAALRYHLLNIHGKHNCEKCRMHFLQKDELLRHECVPPNMSQLENENNPAVESDPIAVPLDNNLNGTLAESLTEPKDIVVIEITECSDGLDDGESLKDADENSDYTVDESEDSENNSMEYCETCDKKVKNMDRHVANYHSKLMCDICLKEFRSSYKLQLHVQIHNGVVPNECRYCQKKFHHKVKLVEHERTHTKEKPYECNFCQKSFAQKSVLGTHMRQHTGRPEVCEICGKRFCRKADLRLHLSKHTGEKPHLCSICGKNFGQKSHLNQHMISHREDRPHQCPFCDKAFKKKQLLKRHLRLHSGNKPFGCSHCSYTCYRQYRLREHMKIHAGQILEAVNDNNGQVKC